MRNFAVSSEVHICYNPSYQYNLKTSTQEKRDAKNKPYEEIPEITDDTIIPKGKWPDFLSNRKNKRKLIEFIGF